MDLDLYIIVIFLIFIIDGYYAVYLVHYVGIKNYKKPRPLKNEVFQLIQIL